MKKVLFFILFLICVVESDAVTRIVFRVDDFELKNDVIQNKLIALFKNRFKCV